MDKYVKEPKSTLTKEIKKIANSKEMSEQKKLEDIKEVIKGYIVDFEIPCFE